MGYDYRYFSTFIRVLLSITLWDKRQYFEKDAGQENLRVNGVVKALYRSNEFFLINALGLLKKPS
ncbi:MAG: hypothetical protein Rpha_1723 [Candidatus Ruthia sp. Apha_13_S6]|nr:hypothetical protein [Candidatus Ruthia sp. Apha_13_S6]